MPTYYKESVKKAVLKYQAEKTHRIAIRYRKELYEEVLRPAILRSGLTETAFIKLAIEEKLKRDGLLDQDSPDRQ